MGIVGGNFGSVTYSMVNDPYVALQSFNPFQDREKITNIAGYGVNQSERLDSGVSTISSRFSSMFKGTILTQTSHARRGMYNRNLNKGIRAINNKYGSFRSTVKSNTEMFAPIIRDDMKNNKK